jgi:hypothetical protein
MGCLYLSSQASKCPKDEEKQQALRRGYGSRHANDTDRVDVGSRDNLRRDSDPLVTAIDGLGKFFTPADYDLYRLWMFHVSHVLILSSSAMTDDMSIQSGLGGGRFSPPSSLTHQQGSASALHNALVGCGGVGNNLDVGRQYSGVPASFVVTSSGATSYGDMSVPYQSSRMTNGPHFWYEQRRRECAAI